MRVWGTTFTLVDVRLLRVILRKPLSDWKIDVENTSALKVFFEFPPIVVRNALIFTYVLADILLNPKSPDSAQTVESSRRTSSQNATRHKNMISAHRNMISSPL